MPSTSSLYGELQLGQTLVGQPKLRYSDHTKSVLRKCCIPQSQLDALAEDRVLWSLTCATGLKNLAAAAEQAASDRRARRHAAATATPAGPLCPHYGTIYASDFGLRRHLRVHLMTVQQTITSVQRHRRNRRSTTSKQKQPGTVYCWGMNWLRLDFTPDILWPRAV